MWHVAYERMITADQGGGMTATAPNTTVRPAHAGTGEYSRHVHGGGLAGSRMLDELAIAKKVAARIEEGFGPKTDPTSGCSEAAGFV
jgi:hypothetical protein